MNMDLYDPNIQVIYEQGTTETILPGMYAIVRCDGKGFTKFTKDSGNFVRPFDKRFHDLMVDTVKHLVKNSGFKILFAYTESDEMSFLLDPNDNHFGRRVHKTIATFAGMASSYFAVKASKLFKKDILVSFDARVSIRPNIESATQYFLWRQDGSYRNSLNEYCYWLAIESGKSKRQAGALVESLNNKGKHDLLFNTFNINYNDLPGWQKKGVCVTWEDYLKEGFNPLTKEKTLTPRRRITVDEDMPVREDLINCVKEIVDAELSK